MLHYRFFSGKCQGTSVDQSRFSGFESPPASTAEAKQEAPAETSLTVDMAGKEKEEATADAAASPAETKSDAPAETSQTVDTAGKEKQQAGENAPASKAEEKPEAPAETSLTGDTDKEKECSFSCQLCRQSDWFQPAISSLPPSLSGHSEKSL